MDFDKTITNNRKRLLSIKIPDQTGVLYTELPPGGTMDVQSDNAAVSNPLPLPGGLSFECGSGELGVAVITATPGGTLDPSTAGPNFAPRTGRITVIQSQPAGFSLELGEEELEEPATEPI